METIAEVEEAPELGNDAPKTLGEAVALLVEADEEKKEIEADLKRVKARAKNLGGVVKTMLLNNGLHQVKTQDSKKTVYLRQILGASVIDKSQLEKVADALDELGYHDLLKTDIPAPTLKKVIGEILDHDESGKPVLPESLAGLVKVFEDYDVSVRAS